MELIKSVSFEADEAEMVVLGRVVVLGAIASDQSLDLIRRTDADEQDAEFKQYVVQYAINTDHPDCHLLRHRRVRQILPRHARRRRNAPPSQFEAWFVSLAHTDRIIEETIDAAEGAFEAVHS